MTFLVLDDETIMVDTMTQMLNEQYQGSKVYPFSDVNEALDTLSSNLITPDIAFLDIEMPVMDGLTFAKALKDISPQTKIIFVTGYSQYAVNAFNARSNGYLLKPFRPQELKAEVDSALSPRPRSGGGRVRIQTFNGFEVFVDGRVVSFPRASAKELLAVLVDSKGEGKTLRELAFILWGDGPFTAAQRGYLSTAIKDMLSVLKAVGARDIVVKGRNRFAVDPKKFDCDYYNFLSGDIAAINAYHGGYMPSYAWAEFTTAV